MIDLHGGHDLKGFPTQVAALRCLLFYVHRGKDCNARLCADTPHMKIEDSSAQRQGFTGSLYGGVCVRVM